MSAALLDYEEIQKPELLQTGVGFAARAEVLPREFPVFEMPVEGESVKLRRPLVLRVSLEKGEYFVENETLSLFGNGPNLSGAVADFLSGLASTWSHYRTLREDQVIGRGIEMKRVFERLTE